MHSEDALKAFQEIEEKPKKWDPLQHTKDIISYDYGYIDFTETKTTNSKVSVILNRTMYILSCPNVNKNLLFIQFVRCSLRTKVDKLVNLMFTCWKLRVPDLIISITGGAKNFDLSNTLIDLLRTSLVNTALSTSKLFEM